MANAAFTNYTVLHDSTIRLSGKHPHGICNLVSDMLNSSKASFFSVLVFEAIYTLRWVLLRFLFQ